MGLEAAFPLVASALSYLSARQAQSFQERMSSTAIQRAAADARRAGVSPQLAIGQLRASSPSGSEFGLEGGELFSTARALREQRRLNDSSISLQSAQERVAATTAANLAQRFELERPVLMSEQVSAAAVARQERAAAESAELDLVRQRAEAAMYRRAPWLVAVPPVSSAVGVARDVSGLLRRRAHSILTPGR